MVWKIKISVFANEKYLIFSYLTRFSFASSFAEITTLAHTNRGFRLQYFLLKNRFANGILLILRDWRHIRLQDRLLKQPLSSSTYLQVQAVSFAEFKDQIIENQIGNLNFFAGLITIKSTYTTFW
jgi:hypothetical protein